MTATILICIAIAVIVILGVRSYMKRVSSGCCGSGGGGTVKKIRVPDKDKSHYPIVRFYGSTEWSAATAQPM